MLSKLLSLFQTTNIVSVRGATTTNSDTKKEIEIKTNKLLEEIFSSNNIRKEDILFIVFSSTEDLKSYYPATVARKNFGLINESLFSTTEPKIKNNLKLCIRILIIFKSKIPQKDLKFIYLENTKNLRIK
ncbi:MAG: chorismate mutase [Chloroflexi bacterium]|jgi:chorismate mutase|nr:chorismate mutase [Chloroflexota bacterium]MDP7197102.1 chorismate mutase [SAR202 cluster bacterium]|tara:strand:+ start:11604 stop:11993 length:390 start_codon:yes stop_codon:yes gene_type:complete